jgi:hypothetical protein
MGTTVDAVKATSTTVYQVFIDNTANAGAPSYVKFFNLAQGSVVLGTTVPDEVIYVPAAARITQLLYTSAAPGKIFATALSAACVTTGGTAGTVAPTSSVVVTVNYT